MLLGYFLVCLTRLTPGRFDGEGLDEYFGPCCSLFDQTHLGKASGQGQVSHPWAVVGMGVVALKPPVSGVPEAVSQVFTLISL